MSVSAQEYQSKIAQSEKLRNQHFQLQEKIVKLEGETKILTTKSSAFEKQLKKMVSQNKSLIALLEKQQQQKLVLLAKDRQLTNNQNRGQVEARRNESLAKNLSQEVQKLRSQLSNTTTQRIEWIKEKQQLSNKLLILEQRYKATQNLNQVILLLKNSLADISKENETLKSQISDLKKKQNSGTSIEKTVIKADSETIDHLIKDFQQKLNGKQRAIVEQREKYQNIISQLNLKIAQLQANSQRYL